MSLTTVDYLVKSNEDWTDSLYLSTGEGEDEVATDLTGSSFIAHFRATPDTLHVAVEASTANGRIIITDPATDGEISWNVPSAVLRSVEPGTYVYDMVWHKPGGAEDTFVSGILTIERGITRP